MTVHKTVKVIKGGQEGIMDSEVTKDFSMISKRSGTSHILSDFTKVRNRDSDLS
jgi:hypothetical protein